MKIKEQNEYQFPEYALCELINGDESSETTEEDMANLEAFLKKESSVDVWAVKQDENGDDCEPYFCNSPEFGLPCMVVDLIGTTFLKERTK